MKKLNIVITSAVCASLMAVSASAASNECVPVYESINRINTVMNSINISDCNVQTILQSLLGNCINGEFPSFPDLPNIDETPDQEQLPDLPDIPEQEAPDNGGIDGNISGNISEFERRVVELVNAERSKNGLQLLSINVELSSIAREKSRDMQRNGYFNHISPTYGSPFDMLKKFGVSYNAAGENIAKGYNSPESVVNGWMNSAGHRANILSGNFTEIGVGHIANGNYWTQLFIG